MLHAFRSAVSRIDRVVGRVVWTVAAVGLLGVAAFVAYAGVQGFLGAPGGERWAVLALSLAASTLFVAFAWQAGQRRELSDALDDDA